MGHCSRDPGYLRRKAKLDRILETTSMERLLFVANRVDREGYYMSVSGSRPIILCLSDSQQAAEALNRSFELWREREKRWAETL
jgi:hypothetical protein